MSECRGPMQRAVCTSAVATLCAGRGGASGVGSDRNSITLTSESAPHSNFPTVTRSTFNNGAPGSRPASPRSPSRPTRPLLLPLIATRRRRSLLPTCRSARLWPTRSAGNASAQSWRACCTVGRREGWRSPPHAPLEARPPALLQPLACCSIANNTTDSSRPPPPLPPPHTSGPDPIMALRLLHRLRIFGAVFALPPAAAAARSDPPAFGAAATGLAAAAFDVLQAWPPASASGSGGDAATGDAGNGNGNGSVGAGGGGGGVVDLDLRRRCLLAAVLLPVAGVMSPAAKGKTSRCVIFVCIDAAVVVVLLQLQLLLLLPPASSPLPAASLCPACLYIHLVRSAASRRLWCASRSSGGPRTARRWRRCTPRPPTLPPSTSSCRASQTACQVGWWALFPR